MIGIPLCRVKPKGRLLVEIESCVLSLQIKELPVLPPPLLHDSLKCNESIGEIIGALLVDLDELLNSSFELQTDQSFDLRAEFFLQRLQVSEEIKFRFILVSYL